MSEKIAIVIFSMSCQYIKNTLLIQIYTLKMYFCVKPLCF